MKLSGGEKQRLAIAQVLLRNPQVLLLDEPTSALDAVTESLLQDDLEQCFRGKTMMVVAHRLATIRNADRIIVIEEGKVIEMGTHAELIEKKRSVLSTVFGTVSTKSKKTFNQPPKPMKR